MLICGAVSERIQHQGVDIKSTRKRIPVILLLREEQVILAK